jgi:Bacterial antitoxin of type II TA system, VapB
MRTNIEIDDRVMKEAQRLLDNPTKRETCTPMPDFDRLASCTGLRIWDDLIPPTHVPGAYGRAHAAVTVVEVGRNSTPCWRWGRSLSAFRA